MIKLFECYLLQIIVRLLLQEKEVGVDAEFWDYGPIKELKASSKMHQKRMRKLGRSGDINIVTYKPLT
jgi:hypothetical protein